MADIQDVLASNIRHYMDLRGMDQGALAKAAGINKSVVSRIEGKAQRSWPEIGNLRKIAAALGLKDETPLFYIEPRPSKHSDYPIKDCAQRVADFMRGYADPAADYIKNRYREPATD